MLISLEVSAGCKENEKITPTQRSVIITEIILFVLVILIICLKGVFFMLFVLLIIFVFISFVLYCALRVSTEYDEWVDDEEQEKFVKETNSPDSH